MKTDGSMRMEQKILLNLLNKEDSLPTIQSYIKQVIMMRGLADQSIEKELLLLMEEVGELAKVIGKNDMEIDYAGINSYNSVENEIAGIFIILISICNTLRISLFEALIAKETINV